MSQKTKPKFHRPTLGMLGIAVFTFLAGCSSKPTGSTPSEVVLCPGRGAGAPQALDVETCASQLDFAGPERARAGLVRSLRWQKTNLTVRFMNGDPRVQAQVKRYAQQWSDLCGITFDFGDHHPADIRLSFTCTGHWSAIGSSGRNLSDNRPTMNLKLTASTPESEIRRVTLHEFGHALGLIHEHQSPAGGIQWNEPAVIAYYQRTQGWDEAKTRVNVINRASATEVNATAFDPRSIMLYPIPRELTLDGFHSDWNTQLSEQDQAFIGAIYPKS
jgi:hypothetical protein